MKILVTGGTGYIGSHTVVELLKEDFQVVIVDNLGNSSAYVLDQIEKEVGKRPLFYCLDLRDKASLESVFTEHSFDAVLHFAGYKAAGESVDMPLDYYENNLISSIYLFQLMEQYEVCTLIFSSSAVVYGTREDIPYGEDLPMDLSVNPYGRSKAMIEMIIEDMTSCRKDMGAVALRYFNPLGASESGFLGEPLSAAPTNIMPYMTQVASGKLAYVEVFGDDYATPDGSGVRDYLHVLDLAKGHLLALKYALSHRGFEIVNLGSGKGTSVLELIQTFERVTGVPVPFRIVGRRKGDIPFSLADTRKAWEMMGWKAEKSLEEMCKDAWNWEQKNL